MNTAMMKMLAATGISAFLVMGCGEEEKTPVKAAEAVVDSQNNESASDEKSAVDKMKEGAKEKAAEVSGDVSEKTGAMLEQAKDVSGDMVEKAKDVTSDSIETVKEVTADTIESAKEVTAQGADKVKAAME